MAKELMALMFLMVICYEYNMNLEAVVEAVRSCADVLQYHHIWKD